MPTLFLASRSCLGNEKKITMSYHLGTRIIIRSLTIRIQFKESKLVERGTWETSALQKTSYSNTGCSQFPGKCLHSLDIFSGPNRFQWKEGVLSVRRRNRLNRVELSSLELGPVSIEEVNPSIYIVEYDFDQGLSGEVIEAGELKLVVELGSGWDDVVVDNIQPLFLLPGVEEEPQSPRACQVM